MNNGQSRLDWETSRLLRRESEKKNIFQGIMETAKRIGEENPYALKDLVKVLGMKWQVDFMTHPFIYEHSFMGTDPYIEWFSLWCGGEGRDIRLTPDGKDFYDLGKPTGQRRTLSLSRDLIIPIDIISSQFKRAVFCLKDVGSWSSNYDPYIGWVWEPAGIAIVEDKNSLLARKLLHREGEIEIHSVYDYSAVYEFVHCDGEHFIRTWDGYKLAPVFDVALAAIFEIGRIILKGRNKGWNPFRRIKS